MVKTCIELESEPCDEGKDCHMNCCDLCLCKFCEKAQCQDEEEDDERNNNKKTS